MACIKATVQDVINCSNEGGAGLGQHIGIAFTNDVAAEPTTPALTEELTNEAYVTATGNFVMLPGKRFARFQTLFESGMFSMASVGTPGSLNADSTTTFRLQNSKGALGALRKIENEACIVSLVNADGLNLVSGTIDFPAVVTAYALKNDKGESYIEITLRASSRKPYYTNSVIPFEAAVI